MTESTREDVSATTSSASDESKPERTWQPPSSSFDPWRGTRISRRRHGQSIRHLPAPPKNRAGADLPAYSVKEKLIEALNARNVVLVTGATGSGKTTQIPQMILDEARSKGQVVNIAVTQPRQVAAISVAQRVRTERKWDSTGPVGYSVRNNTSLPSSVDSGSILYCTEGTLLARMSENPLLSGVSHLILDEVHERTKEMDVLLTLVKTSLLKDTGIKVILMSATANVRQFMSYFGHKLIQKEVNLVAIPDTNYEVKDYYLEDVFQILDWAPDDKDADDFVDIGDSMRSERMPCEEKIPEAKLDRNAEDFWSKAAAEEFDLTVLPTQVIEQLLLYIEAQESYNPSEGGAVLIFLPGLGSINKLIHYVTEVSSEQALFKRRFNFIPLHSKTAEQYTNDVFKVNTDRRKIKCVIGTNIAETSLTVPDLTYVIDCCKQKVKTTPTRLEVCWTGRSNCIQRRGRAGRTHEGICFHLIPKIRFKVGLAMNPDPEMTRMPMIDIALNLLTLGRGDALKWLPGFCKAMPDPPKQEAVRLAVSQLLAVGAVDKKSGLLTELGRTLSRFPVGVYTALGLIASSILFDSAEGIYISVSLCALLEMEDIEANTQRPGDIDNPKKVDPASLHRMGYRELWPAEGQITTPLPDQLDLLRFYLEWEQVWFDRGVRSAKEYCKRRDLKHSSFERVWQDRNAMLDILCDRGLAATEPAADFVPGGRSPFSAIGEHMYTLECVLAVLCGPNYGQVSMKRKVAIDVDHKTLNCGSWSSIGTANARVVPGQMVLYTHRLDVWPPNQPAPRCIAKLICPINTVTFILGTSVELTYKRREGSMIFVDIFVDSRKAFGGNLRTQELLRLRKHFQQAMGGLAKDLADGGDVLDPTKELIRRTRSRMTRAIKGEQLLDYEAELEIVGFPKDAASHAGLIYGNHNAPLRGPNNNRQKPKNDDGHQKKSALPPGHTAKNNHRGGNAKHRPRG
ncbi:ATP-dependent RNA helicase, putative [Perkinsus marinus ATCC 50983]|uniref:ATP-dependent RNA helicase, putative n=1 Tax=Perkinsus marinus (strain ATCC 50983 / TXsc) TaxID=423536 RepID=C5LH79_PERM5|nr:ATP-dependent RNA helicase, putative [Perkinsus marinus ATCC 50983]EER03888.1 ATP-dependent RNA helicase, putative [Perkinsus marinus ATCC 50983]|eukprot:XP_002772072.1 ATP-dependent RNA helicase, putative [Perkinsus marinus ATCC 50983]